MNFNRSFGVEAERDKEKEREMRRRKRRRKNWEDASSAAFGISDFQANEAQREK